MKVMGCVFFEVRTGCLNVIKTSFGLKGQEYASSYGPNRRTVC
jgi:hypothetical protein